MIARPMTPLAPRVVEAGAHTSSEHLAELLRRDGARFERELHEAGAVLFRGFDVGSAEDLALVVAARGEATMRYVGGDSPRRSVHGDVYTSTETPPSYPIALHNEMSYFPVYPRRLWFACTLPAEEGGETTLADGRAVLAALDPWVRALFVERGVTYVRALRGAHRLLELVDRIKKVTRSWMETFETHDREVVARRCSEMGASFRFTDQDWLELETTRPAVIRHPSTGESAWFNQAHLFRLSTRAIGPLRHAAARAFFALTGGCSHHARFGDGTELDDETLDHVFDVLDAHTLRLRWQKGDVLWVDNLLVMHGRAPYRGSRRVLVTMTE